MQDRRSIFPRIAFVLIAQFLLLLAIVALAQATGGQAAPPATTHTSPGATGAGLDLAPPASVDFSIARNTLLDEPTTLELAILSSPWATLDSNAGEGEEVPKVFVVEAVVTNTGGVTATDLVVDLDYNEEPADNWILLPGEEPQRSLDELAPGAAYHVYWFARYSLLPGATHEYTVTAQATNANPVATSENYYENPDGATVKTRSTLSTGNSGVTRTSANISVGVAFTVTVDYDLGSNPVDAHLSPVGNVDFAAGSYRLLASQVDFYNASTTLLATVADRLYFPTLPPSSKYAQATYTFIAVALEDTRVCPYTTVGYNSNHKYDQFYCEASHFTIIPITGTLSLSMTKEVSDPTVEQGGLLTYTIHYTNEGSLTLSYVWIWDDVDLGIASVVTDAVAPAPEAGETTPSRVAWYLGTLTPGASGTLTFTVLVDGDGSDVADGTLLVNHAYFGINQGSVPELAALTGTVTSTVLAPDLVIAKTDGRATAEPGQVLTYTLRITNSGSVPAANVVITDVLPAEVSYLPGTADPFPTSEVGQSLVWEGLGPIAPGNSLTITVPVTVQPVLPNGTQLANAAAVQYQNSLGWAFEPRVAEDTTLVNAPVLSISKIASPDPVLAGRTITYTLSYENNGPAAATNVVISDVVPMSTTYASCSGGSSCGEADGIVQWEIGTLASGSSQSVTFSVEVSDSLQTGSLIHNDDYGITADQTGFIAGPPVVTVVNRDAAIFDGYTFVDLNGNGRYDEAVETTLTGVTISLPASTGSPTTTNEAGYYRLRVEVPGPVSISAELPAGYFRTTAGTVLTDAVLGLTQTVNFGYAPWDAGFGVVYGTVYDDADHSSQRELGESGLPGVDVSSAMAVTQTVQTDTYGRYTLQYQVDGTDPVSVTIIEDDPDGYVSTTPNEMTTDVMNGSSDGSPVDFGDFYGILVTGQVFHDADVDGQKDALEVGVAGATVSGDGDSYSTASSGVYTLYVTLQGTDPVAIQETDPAGYVSTAALPGTGMEVLGANSLRIPSPVAGSQYTNGDFGDVPATSVVTISGTVWDDNGAGGGTAVNGLRDGGEPGLAGAVVSLSSGLTQTTGIDGAFLLYAPPGMAITVTETNPEAYVSTNAIPGNGATKLNHDALVVDLPPEFSTSSGNLFGDVALAGTAVITGTVFDDANENGLRDEGEAGLAGVMVTLEIEGGPAIDVPTSATGEYQFAVAPGTNVRLSSAGPGGIYYPTTPEVFILRPPAAGVYAAYDFGYSDDTGIAVIYGLVFDDVNSNAWQDFGEPGLGGAVVELEGHEPVTTAATGPLAGTFVFTVTGTSVYAVYETNPAGYRSTTPDQINVNVLSLDQSYFVSFGDVNNPETATIYGTVFDDQNSNGQQDPTEPGLAGVVISATVGGETGVVTATTRAYGQFTYGFEVARPGIHTVSERDPALPGYHSTTPDEIRLDVLLGESYIANFGDTADTNPLSTIMGIVFYDADGNGVQDAAELGIAGVNVALSEVVTATGTYGQYTFAVDASGYYQVTETDLPGYHSTTPNTVTVHVQGPGEVYVVNFGDNDDAFSTSLLGTVFEDSNVNGARDGEEMGLAGVTVSLADSTGTWPNPPATNEWGQYTFLLEQTGVYTVTETDPDGYLSTAALPGDPAVIALDANTLRAEVNSLGTDLGDNLFGDVQATQAVTISGSVWDDNGAAGGTAANGLRDGAEPWLAGALVSLSSGLVAATGPDGAFLLYAPPEQAITISETNPAGYTSTGAIAGGSATRVDDDHLQVDPLPGGSTSGGNLFGDVLPADLHIVKSDDPDPVVPGGVLTYTLFFANESMQFSSDVYLTDVLDANTAFGGVVSQAAGWQGPAIDAGPQTVLTWYTPTLGAGASGRVVFTVTVSAEVTHGMTLTNTARISGTVPEASTGNNAYTETTRIAPDEATIYGTVFEDLDGDGQQGGLEPGLAGVLLTLGETFTATSDLDGAYTFVVTEAMTYTLVETDPEEYLSTTPNVVTIPVALGDVVEVNFGDLWIGHCGCPPDEYEEDDGVSQAVTLTAGLAQTHDFCDDASDWTSFSVQAGQVFTVTTSSWGRRADTFLALYDSDGMTRLAANDDYEGSTDFSSRIVWQAPADGTYSVQVSNQAGLTGCLTDYDLWLEAPAPQGEYNVYLPIVARNVDMAPVVTAEEAVEPRGVITHVCPDGYEVDDTWQQAKPLELGVAQVHSFDSNPAVYAADKDFVKLDLAAGDSVTVSVTSLTNTMTVLELYDAQGNALGLLGDTELGWTAGEDATYIVGIGPLAPDYTDFGCAAEVGYTVVAEMPKSWTIYLPLTQRHD